VTLEILDAGWATTIQDAGRPGWGHLGVPIGGAADPWSLGVANLLVGNSSKSAALEVTLGGFRARAVEPVVVGVAGADLGGDVRPGEARLLEPGDVLELPGATDRDPRGSRAYVALAGGVDVPAVLGSRSTCLAAGFGGLEGRPLRAGDRIAAEALRPARAVEGARAPWPDSAIAPVPAGGLRVIRNTQAATAPSASTVDALLATTWTITPESDRMGLRLDAENGARLDADARSLTSFGVVRGAIQVPPDGRPIVLLADHQPTGGYSIAAVVIAADLPALGQLAPGATARFQAVDGAAARAALMAQRATWDRLVRHHREDAGWDDLWRSAGA
jgi:biotin-dependent carboxylase-like uncharacterized protein